MKGLHSKADSCFNQSWGRSEVTVERSVFSLRIAISNLGPQTGWITPSRQAACSSASQKILRVLRNSMVQYLVHNSPLLSLPSVRSIQHKTPIPVTGTKMLILSSHLRLSSTCLYPKDFPIKSLYTALSFPLRATFSVILRFLRGFPLLPDECPKVL